MKILSTSVNNPGFIELQNNSIKKYVNMVSGGEGVNLTVFNDAKNWNDFTNFNLSNKINKNMVSTVCNNRCYVTCIDVPNDSSQQATPLKARYASTLNTMMTYMFDNPDQYLVIDSDMFFVAPIDITQLNSCYFGYVDISGNGTDIPSPNMFYVDTVNLANKNLINWNITDGSVDAAWLASLKLEGGNAGKITEFTYLSSLTWDASNLPVNINSNVLNFFNYDPRNMSGKYYAEIYNNNILHFKAASNWLCNDLQPCNPYNPDMLKLIVRLTNVLRQTFTML